jgi:heavy metal sensor kinase
VRFFRSIRVRFTGWYLVILSVLLTALGIGLYATLSYTLQRNQDFALEHRVVQLEASDEVRVALDEGRLGGVLGETGALFRYTEGQHSVLSTGGAEQMLDPAWIDAALAGSASHHTVRSEDGTPFRFYVSLLQPHPGVLPRDRDPAPGASSGSNQDTILTAPSPVVIAVGQPMDKTLEALSALKRTLWIAIPITLLVSSGGGLFLVRRALMPIDRIVQTARGIEGRDLSGRVPVASEDELGRLTRTINAMLGRLERSFRRQRQFADDASHELRSPLAVIQAEATLALRRDRDREAYRQSLTVIADEARSMNHLIDQLLTLARGDRAAEVPNSVPVDVDTLIQSSVEEVSSLAASNRGRLHVYPGPPGSRVAILGDETQLRRVLRNLLDNAIRYTQAGGEIRLSAGRDGAAVEITVADSGIGIAAHHLDHIFERFYRVDMSRGRRGGGGGLGLAICRQIVEAHGGTIQVSSEEGVGTTFRVRLPAAESDGTV